MRNPAILLVGSGKLGLPLARELAQRHPVAVLSRRPPSEPDLTGLPGDVTRPETLQLPGSIEVVIYCLSPGSYTDEAYRGVFVEGLGNVLNALDRDRLRRVLFVSSTGVYHQDDDSWVDEESPAEPKGFAGQRLLEGERLLRASGLPATSVRFSGIYGDGRTRLLEQVLAGELRPEPGGPYTNRIHEQDCLGVLAHLTELSLAGEELGECYLASDCEPVRIGDLVAWLRQELGYPPLKPDARTPERRAGSKRCRNQRLLATGYRFRYPSFREGYEPLVRRLAGQRKPD